MVEDRELTYEERRRLDTEWMTTNALRDAMARAYPDPERITYKQVFALGHQVAQSLFSSDYRILDNPRESQAAQAFRQSAEAQSRLENRVITPVEHIDEEIYKTK